MKLSQKRKDRYLEKLDKIEERTEEIQEWFSPGAEVVQGEPQYRLAIYKAFQEAAEAVADLCAMFMADSDRAVGDDYENIEKSSGKIFPESIRSELMEANGLRNRVVHEYNKFEDLKALTSIQNLLPSLERFHEEVRGWIKKR